MLSHETVLWSDMKRIDTGTPQRIPSIFTIKQPVHALDCVSQTAQSIKSELTDRNRWFWNDSSLWGITNCTSSVITWKRRVVKPRLSLQTWHQWTDGDDGRRGVFLLLSSPLSVVFNPSTFLTPGNRSNCGLLTVALWIPIFYSAVGSSLCARYPWRKGYQNGNRSFKVWI